MIAKDPKIAITAGAGFLATIGLCLCAASVMPWWPATGITIIVFAVIMFMVIIRLAIRADKAIDGVRRITDTLDMGER